MRHRGKASHIFVRAHPKRVSLRVGLRQSDANLAARQTVSTRQSTGLNCDTISPVETNGREAFGRAPRKGSHHELPELREGSHRRREVRPTAQPRPTPSPSSRMRRPSRKTPRPTNRPRKPPAKRRTPIPRTKTGITSRMARRSRRTITSRRKDSSNMGMASQPHPTRKPATSPATPKPSIP